jgi:hypothetical protein
MAKSYTRMPCIPSLGTPRISLYWAKIHIIYINSFIINIIDIINIINIIL